MSSRNLLKNTAILALIIGILTSGFPLKNSAYSQSVEDRVVAKARQLNQPALQGAEEAAIELLRKVMANVPIDSAYYMRRRAKLMAAIREMEEVGYSRAMTDAVLDLTRKYDPNPPQEFIDKLRGAGVSEKQIDKILKTPRYKLVEGASLIRGRGYDASLRSLVNQLDQVFLQNEIARQKGPRIQLVSFTTSALFDWGCLGAVLVAVGTAALSGAACGASGGATCAAGVVVTVGAYILAREECLD